MTESLNKPFGIYIKLFFSSLQDEIAAWLTVLGKSIDDVTSWEIKVSPRSPFAGMGMYEGHSFVVPNTSYNVRITIAFADSDTKYEKKFTCGSLRRAEETLRSHVAVPDIFQDAFQDGELEL